MRELLKQAAGSSPFRNVLSIPRKVTIPASLAALHAGYSNPSGPGEELGPLQIARREVQ